MGLSSALELVWNHKPHHTGDRNEFQKLWRLFSDFWFPFLALPRWLNNSEQQAIERERDDHWCLVVRPQLPGDCLTASLPATLQATWLTDCVPGRPPLPSLHPQHPHNTHNVPPPLLVVAPKKTVCPTRQLNWETDSHSSSVRRLSTNRLKLQSSFSKDKITRN